MQEHERIALEMWQERAQARLRANAARTKPVVEHLDTGLILATVLGNLTVIPNWRDVAIRNAEGELANSRRFGNPERIARAERQVERARRAAGLSSGSESTDG